LSVQYKPILTTSFLSELISDSSWGMSKYTKFYIQNVLKISPDESFGEGEKRLAICLNILNIGRGEANHLTIKTAVTSTAGECWETVLREYKEICTSNGIEIMFFKKLTEREWEQYDNKRLATPVSMYIEIDYIDLVGYRHSLSSYIAIKSFIHMKDADNQLVPYVLVLNPYDSTIINETSDENQI